MQDKISFEDKLILLNAKKPPLHTVFRKKLPEYRRNLSLKMVSITFILVVLVLLS